MINFVLKKKARKTLVSEKFGKTNEPKRHDWVETQLKSLPKGAKILDVGAGECQYKKHCDHLKYTSQDISLYDGHGDESGLHTQEWDTHKIDVTCDILDFPSDIELFDAILCTEVLEHVPDPVAVLKKICSLLNPEGVLLLTAPFGSLTHFAPYHFATGFNRYFYQHHLAAFGFDIEILEENGSYYEMIAQELFRSSGMANDDKRKKRTKTTIKTSQINALIHFLQKREEEDHKRSVELACFGYHVRAKKRKTQNAATQPAKSP